MSDEYKAGAIGVIVLIFTSIFIGMQWVDDKTGGLVRKIVMAIINKGKK